MMRLYNICHWSVVTDFHQCLTYCVVFYSLYQYLLSYVKVSFSIFTTYKVVTFEILGLKIGGYLNARGQPAKKLHITSYIYTFVVLKLCPKSRKQNNEPINRLTFSETFWGLYIKVTVRHGIVKYHDHVK